MKFDENRQRQVIRDLQRHFHVDLTKVGRARNYLVDGNGARYIVLGGDDYRRGVPCAIFEEEERAGGEALLVVAVLDREDPDIFVGPFRPLLDEKDRLRLSEDRYVFHLHRFPGNLIVREIPSLELRQIDRDISAVARKPLPGTAAKARSRPARNVIAVEGNLVRADFQKKKRK
jgi:hypothetical protein